MGLLESALLERLVEQSDRMVRALGILDWKVGKIMGLIEDVDATVQVVESAVEDLAGAVSDVETAATSFEAKVAGFDLAPEQMATLTADLDALKAAKTKLAGVHDALEGVATSLNSAGQPGGPVAGSTAPVTVPVESGPATLPPPPAPVPVPGDHSGLGPDDSAATGGEPVIMEEPAAEAPQVISQNETLAQQQ